jgi:Zn-dependent protease
MAKKLVATPRLWQFLIMPTRNGSIHLFQLFGITVYLHWSWFLAFYILPKLWGREFSNYGWIALEILALFLIVLTHEFGHQLACRQVGGQTHDIVLFPLGGVAYVNPPQRPAAQLWSIAAGPLVNVALIPVFAAAVSISWHFGLYDKNPDAYELVQDIRRINIGLLIFNMMPIYPLDGGQILRSLLWFPFGRANSLFVASIIGFIGVIGLFLLAGLLLLTPYKGNAVWTAVMAAFILMNCWGGLMQARALAKMAKTPRREGFACPVCKTAPPLGAIWRCGKCRQPFDTFETQGVCPHCQTQYAATSCPECGNLRPFSEWRTSASQ